MLDTTGIKARARRLRQFMQTKLNIALSHSQALEAISFADQGQDWNTVSATLPGLCCETAVTCPRPGVEFTFSMDAHLKRAEANAGLQQKITKTEPHPDDPSWLGYIAFNTPFRLSPAASSGHLLAVGHLYGNSTLKVWMKAMLMWAETKSTGLWLDFGTSLSAKAVLAMTKSDDPEDRLVVHDSVASFKWRDATRAGQKVYIPVPLADQRAVFEQFAGFCNYQMRTGDSGAYHLKMTLIVTNAHLLDETALSSLILGANVSNTRLILHVPTLADWRKLQQQQDDTLTASIQANLLFDTLENYSEADRAELATWEFQGRLPQKSDFQDLAYWACIKKQQPALLKLQCPVPGHVAPND